MATDDVTAPTTLPHACIQSARLGASARITRRQGRPACHLPCTRSGYRADVEAWITPPDREQKVWRIEVKYDGHVEVRRLVGRSSVGQPLPGITTLDALGRWLVERGIDPGSLRHA